MQTKSPVFEDVSNLLTNAFGAAKGVGDEVRAAARARAREFIADMDLVTREEFEVVKEMAAQARMEVEALKAEIEALKAAAKPKRKTARKTAKKPAKK
ncbi:MAG TPA: accessory factor UbiK family protein [Hellea balneolensis]|uniref:Accessory factor UbiK family protein n=1 Tax=Hellea balneolensis TaxID=287478 RepID=A0A7V5U1E0_9PROT|nr:accessory factor UbiK family protein [Hellea balneolensis]